jgi:RNA polymerase sigma-70 factor (ECF subfamily)
MRRYWYLSPIKEIAADFSLSESKVKMSLLRSRNELKLLLEKEGIEL